MRDVRRALGRAADALPVVVSGSGQTFHVTIPLHNPGPATIGVLLSWPGLPGVNPAACTLSLAPKATAASAFTVTAPAEAPGGAALTAALVSGTDTVARDRFPVRHARIGWYSTRQPSAGSALVLRDSTQAVHGRSAWGGPSDCSARATVTRAGDTLVVDVVVTDDSIRTDGGSAWESDGVEVYLDTRAGSSDHSYGAGVAQIACVPHLDSATVSVTCRPAIGGPAVAASCQKLQRGYRMQVRVAPVSRPGKEFRLDIGVNDNDGRGARETQLMWSGTADNWNDTRCFGRMKPVP